jgi:translation elongation factor P/translation initiation factor 5A
VVALTSNDLKNGLNIEVDGVPMRVRASLTPS